MHPRAGEYYATGPETDTVQAALHYQLARNHEAARREFLLPDVGTLIVIVVRPSPFSGMLFKRFHNNNYLTKFGHQYSVARGEVFTFLGNSEPARGFISSSIWLTGSVPAGFE